MKVTIFTSNNLRHNFLINSISEVVDDVNVVQECNTIFPGKVKGFYPKNKLIQNYFKNVNNAQIKIFGKQFVNFKSKKNKLLTLKYGDLSFCKIDFLKDFLKSDLYLVFGASYIKGPLIKFLVKKKAINIHMGISPYYRGSNCNFWAMYDNNPELVGATIHYLTSGLDDGKIIYHAVSEQVSNPYNYTMSTVKSAIVSLSNKIKDKSLFKLKPLKQDKSKEKRYSTQKRFYRERCKKLFKKEKRCF